MAVRVRAVLQEFLYGGVIERLYEPNMDYMCSHIFYIILILCNVVVVGIDIVVLCCEVNVSLRPGSNVVLFICRINLLWHDDSSI